MIVNYSDQEVIKGNKGIFLAGPTPRGNELVSWRNEALKILEELGYDGIVYVPEYSTWKAKEDYVDQAMWERKGLFNADVIAFWIPRYLPEMPGFTTNVEFGYWLPSKKVIYGRPDDAKKIKYLDWLYELDMGEKPINNLRELMELCVSKVNTSNKVKDELESILLSDNIREREEELFRIIPILKLEKGFKQKNPWHVYDVWNHTLLAIENSPKIFEIRLVMLLHDIGKIFSYQEDNLGRHFKGHAEMSRKIAEGILANLGIRDIEILSLIEQHATKIDISLVDESNKEFYQKLVAVQMSDGSAYEVRHAKMILEELSKTKEIIDKIGTKKLIK